MRALSLARFCVRKFRVTFSHDTLKFFRAYLNFYIKGLNLGIISYLRP